MRSLRRATLLIACSLLLVLLQTTPAALADNFLSQNFFAKDPLTNSTGASATSSSFSLISSVGQSATGEATSTSFIVRAGFLYFNDFTPKSKSWRWYDDEADETPTVPLAAENTAPSGVEDQNVVKLRWSVAETGGTGEVGAKFRLQYSTSADFQNAFNVVEQSSCNASSGWCYADGGGTDGAAISTATLSDADSCVSAVGNGCGSHNESGTTTTSLVHAASATAEYEFTVKESGAAPATVYFFRLVLVSASTSVPLDTGASYPSLSTGGGTLSFSIDGLPAATTTSGVTTSVDTSPTSVPFGTLPFDTSEIAAHRLTVTTNAGSGYRIYALEQQALVNGTDDQIPPVAATNDAPASWSAGCTATSSGCWGYHTNASVLEGGSTRFAPNDTYAQFTQTPQEIAYSGSSVASSSVDVVYRLQVTHQQQPGDYASGIVYIITPVF